MPKGPIFCSKNGKWKKELEKRLQTNEKITLTALGKVRYQVLNYIRNRNDIKIVKLETKYMKKREKGLGLKVTVQSYIPTLLKALSPNIKPNEANITKPAHTQTTKPPRLKIPSKPSHKKIKQKTQKRRQKRQI